MVTWGSCTTVKLKVALALAGGEVESVTVAVKLKVPSWLGVPCRVPFDATLIPAGSEPPVSDQA
ncbi:MAG TPA: hypothetical protein VKY15_08265 [Acidimicrobiales bacterium]|nr:hypothetical protein [Acidimicrobiales bacterium]